MVYMHRVITGAREGEHVDHINGNTLDNRRNNLRKCSAQDNVRNRRKPSHRAGRPTTSIYKGVSWQPRESRWYATIGINGQQIVLGRFTDEIEAAHAYDRAARQHFGAFARLNFPRDGEQAA